MNRALRKASPRGVRILADYLTINGFLCKQDDSYTLTPDSDPRSSIACAVYASTPRTVTVPALAIRRISTLAWISAAQMAH